MKDRATVGQHVKSSKVKQFRVWDNIRKEEKSSPIGWARAHTGKVENVIHIGRQPNRNWISPKSRREFFSFFLARGLGIGLSGVCSQNYSPMPHYNFFTKPASEIQFVVVLVLMPNWSGEAVWCASRKNCCTYIRLSVGWNNLWSNNDHWLNSNDGVGSVSVRKRPRRLARGKEEEDSFSMARGMNRCRERGKREREEEERQGRAKQNQ